MSFDWTQNVFEFERSFDLLAFVEIVRTRQYVEVLRYDVKLRSYESQCIVFRRITIFVVIPKSSHEADAIAL